MPLIVLSSSYGPRINFNKCFRVSDTCIFIDNISHINITFPKIMQQNTHYHLSQHYSTLQENKTIRRNYTQ